MKKVLLLCVLWLGMITVSAYNNKLYFVENGNSIVYESDTTDSFMQHLDMIPASNYTDELLIENGTNNKYTLYLKAEEFDQSAYSSELLDYINMKIYLDDSLVYSGNAKGIDYNNDGISLQDAIMLKEFNVGDSSLLRVETELSSEYSNMNNRESAKVSWVFYAQYEKNRPIIIDRVPKTDKSNFKLVIFSLILFLLGLCLIIYEKRSEKKIKKLI